MIINARLSIEGRDDDDDSQHPARVPGDTHSAALKFIFLIDKVKDKRDGHHRINHLMEYDYSGNIIMCPSVIHNW